VDHGLRLFAAQADDIGVLRKLSENKLSPMAGLPSCITMAVESGDPSKGSSVIVFKGTSGCSISWHWHTPTERVMIVSGSAKVEMRGGMRCGYVVMKLRPIHGSSCR
jgi:hypothetical protein